MEESKTPWTRRIGFAVAVAVVGSVVGGAIGFAIFFTSFSAFAGMGTYGGPRDYSFEQGMSIVMYVIPFLWAFGWVPTSLAQLAGKEKAALLMGLTTFGGLVALTLCSPLIVFVMLLMPW